MNARCLTGRIFKALAAPLVMAGMLIGLGSGAASASACVSWTGVQPPSPGTSGNALSSAAVLSSCNAWAVGHYSNGTADQTLVEHWNGSAWKQVASPDPGGADRNNTLDGVAAVSSANIWAVGSYINGTTSQTLIEHWNGTAWTQVASPNLGFGDRLSGVAAVSSSNVWAVGFYSNGTVPQTLILHWNGTAWKHVSSPNPGGSGEDNVLNGVAAVSRGNAWAVGYYTNGDRAQTLIEHWNGTAWKHVSSPNPGGRDSTDFLAGIAATSSTSIWAVGWYSDCTCDIPPQNTLVLHWNGTAWTHVSSPSPGGSNGNLLSGVAGLSSSNAWAVGSYSNGTAQQTLVEHWNGTAWRHVSSPDPGGAAQNNALNGVAASFSISLWAVGYYFNGTADQTLALHCC